MIIERMVIDEIVTMDRDERRADEATSGLLSVSNDGINST